MTGRGARWRLVALALLATGTAAQPGRVDTGVQLRMSERLGEAGPKARTPAPAAAVATTDAAPAAEDGPALPFRGLTLLLASGLRFDDNIFRTSRDEQRDVVITLEPAVHLSGRLGRHDLRLGYRGDIERFQRTPRENRFDHELSAGADLDLERRLKARFGSSLAFGTDPRGELDSRPFAGQEPDRWRRHSAEAGITLGRRIARAQIAARFRVQGTRYLNNAQQVRDLDQRALELEGRYNLGPRLSLLAELSGSWVDYLDPASTLDSREFVARAGVAWEATAKTRGEVRVGRLHRDFHLLGRPSVDGASWEARVIWAPKSYSQLTAYTSREVTDSGFDPGGAAGVATLDVLGLRWRHGFTERLTFDAGAERAVSSFVAGGEDEFIHYDAALRYRLGPRVELLARWDFLSRSSQTGPGFEARSVFLGLETSFEHRPGR